MLQRAIQLHADALVADMHCDTVLYVKAGRDLSLWNDDGHVDIPRLRAGGVNLQLFACFVHSSLKGIDAVRRAEELLDLLEHELNRNKQTIGLCTTAEEAREIIADGRIAVVLGIENGQAINSDLKTLESYYRRGVRCMTLTHTASHEWCSSSSDAGSELDGLTGFGRDVVRRMNDLGMLIDVSHVSPGAVEDVLKVSRDPIVASHSCVQALCDHDRNLTDAQIRAIAESGGLIGVNFCGDFLSQERCAVSSKFIGDHPTQFEQVDRLMSGEYEASEYTARCSELDGFLKGWQGVVREMPTTVSTVADHIDHIVRLVGADHVGIGSDFDGISFPPDRLSDCSQFPNLTEELIRRNYTEADIRKILGGNFMRVFSEVCGG
ncbi:MAG: dipeptidase [Candidatus Zixiibacteriota bacterium]|nr:MAG: dipeptidase [candidate division Zixibacteria bacterium]